MLALSEIINSFALARNKTENIAKGSLFYQILKLVQINYIFYIQCTYIVYISGGRA